MAGAGPSPGGGPPPGEGNWSRWGADDERGALNLIGPDAVRRGMAAVRTGESVSLGLPMITGQGPLAAMRQPMQHFMARDGGDYAAGLPERGGFGFADDSILVACHGTTHLDALAHVWRDGQMWNGFPASSVTSDLIASTPNPPSTAEPTANATVPSATALRNRGARIP